MEKYMSQNGEDTLVDFKLMCFGGEVKSTIVNIGRGSKEGLHRVYYDSNWNRMPFQQAYPVFDYDIKKPKNYEKMVVLAEKLSKNIPFLRVDFYEINNKINFGELTFYPDDGVMTFNPEEWDYKFGEYIHLP